MRKFKLKILNREPGITLLLGILILSAILAISFSLTTILFIEIRSSSDTLRSEGALYGAEGVGEQAFFNLIRKVSSPSYISSFTNNVTLKGPPVVTTTSSPIFVDKIPPGSTFSTTLNRYDFCSLAATTSGCQIGKLVVTYLQASEPSAPLYAYLCQWDPNAPANTYPSLPCTTEGASQGYWIAPNGFYLETSGSVTLNEVSNSTYTWSDNLLPSTQQQQLVLTNISSSATIYFQIATYGPESPPSSGIYPPKGLPLIGETAVTVDAQNGAVGRKIQVIVPEGP